MPWSKRIPVLLSAHSLCHIFRGQRQEATGKAAISSQHSAFSAFLCASVPIRDRHLRSQSYQDWNASPPTLIDSIDLRRVITAGWKSRRYSGLGAGTGSAGALLTGAEARSSRQDDAFVEGMEATRGASGPVVIALSGFSRGSWRGARPG